MPKVKVNILMYVDISVCCLYFIFFQRKGLEGNQKTFYCRKQFEFFLFLSMADILCHFKQCYENMKFLKIKLTTFVLLYMSNFSYPFHFCLRVYFLFLL